MPRMPRRALALPVVAAASLSLAAGALVSATAADPAPRDAERVYRGLAAHEERRRRADYVKLDLLALNDFHGNLETIDPIKSSSGRINNTPAGGAAYLGTLLGRRAREVARRRGHARSRSPPATSSAPRRCISAAFHDEPAVKAMNRVGLQVASVGNHEFDEGYRELLRMQRGGCLEDGPDGADGQNSCPGDQGFDGATFQYLGANVKYDDPGSRPRDTVLPATKVMKVQGEKVGFIGMTLEGTASIVSPSGIQGISFEDEVETANALVPGLRARGVESIVVLLHEGVTPTDDHGVQRLHGCRRPGARDRAGPEARHRRGRLGPHPPALQLRGQGPEGQQPAAHQRRLLRAHGQQAALPHRPGDRRHRAPGRARGEPDRRERR